MISSIANNEKPFDGERNELIKQKKRNIRRNGPKRNKVRGGGGREESKRLKKEKSRRKEKEHKNSRRSSSISFRNNSKRDSKSTNRNFSIPDSSLANRNSPINYSEKRFRLSFEKFKKKINPLSTLAPKNYRTEECRRCPAEISEHIDVGDVYEQEVSAFEELFVMNSENNGQLFVNGKPFWTLKNERPPPEDSVPTKTTINDLVEGKWKLLRSIEIPNDLDEFGPLDVLKSRDFIYFNEPDRLISNTIRSIVLINDPVPAKEEDLFPIAPAYTEVNLMPPEYLYYYNRTPLLKFQRMVETEFCTVQPSIFKKCQNDWISKNGTCYEDSCCMSIETAKSWYYRCAQLSHIFVSILGLFLTFVYFKNYSQKHILPFNVRVFVNIQLFLIIFHSVDMSIIHIYHLFQSFVAIMSNPCFVRVRVDSCALFRYIYSFCTVCLTICQYSLYADRLFCIFWKNYSKFSNYLLVVLLFQMYLISTSLVYFVYKDEDSESYLLSCLNTPVKSLDNLVIVTASLFPINIVCLLLSIILFHAFRNKKERSRFDMTRYFTAKVDAESSEFLFNTTVTQAFHIVIYPIFSILMRLYYDETPRPLHLTFATLSYVISLYCLAVPAVMVSTVKRNRIMKKENIWNHVKLKSIGVEGADNYFNSLQSQWR